MPHGFAGNMSVPTPVIPGALDYRGHDGQSLACYNTLQARSIDSRGLWFPDENHGILKLRNSNLWYGACFDWLNQQDSAGKRR